MLNELGIAQQIIDYGLVAPKYHFRERQTGEVIEFDMTEISDTTPFPFRVQCEQHVMAGMLTDRLEVHEHAEVLYQHRALGFEQDDDGVVAWFETPLEVKKIRARYLIGADGGNSLIRKWLGAEFDGFTYPEKFLCLSTQTELADYIKGLAYVNYVADPEEWLVLLRVPSVWRILLPASEETDDADLLSDEMRDEVFSRLIGKTGIETCHRTIYRVHQRVVQRFNHGRAFLVGDAAHLNNPLGGLGMNSGIHDVWSLQSKLIQCLKEGHNPELLDLWGRQRRAITNSFIQAQTIQNKELLEHGSQEGHARRFARMKATRDDPQKRYEFLLRQSMIASLRDAEQIH
jgi:3-(3-hydroxy-phenyl)propionate hydroxylase